MTIVEKIPSVTKLAVLHIVVNIIVIGVLASGVATEYFLDYPQISVYIIMAISSVVLALILVKDLKK